MSRKTPAYLLLPWLAAAVAVATLVILALFASQTEQPAAPLQGALHYSPAQGGAVAPASGDGDWRPTSLPVVGQLVYVPAYSHVYRGEGDPFLLTVTLSIHNTSMDSSIAVNSIRYFDTNGNELPPRISAPVQVAPLATMEVVIGQNDASGGSGANFLVEWVSDVAVPEPIIETVMIGARSQQGISFARKGTVIREIRPTPDKPEPPAPE